MEYGNERRWTQADEALAQKGYAIERELDALKKTLEVKPTLYLWLLEATDPKTFEYDTHDAYVVAAETEAEARSYWGSPRRIDAVKSIGTAAIGIKPGIVLDSFNAG